jgi:DNA repair photolyase
MGYTIVRLNGDLEKIFKDWLDKMLPDRSDKVMKRIKDCHGGSVHDSRFGTRMRGEGNYAAFIKDQIQLARRKYFSGKTTTPYNLQLHDKVKNPQLTLF